MRTSTLKLTSLCLCERCDIFVSKGLELHSFSFLCILAK